MSAMTGALKARIGRHLAEFPRLAVPRPGLRHAAVAVTIVPDEHGEACFVLTRRAVGLRAHPGQWALPGGRSDDGETTIETALRELEEEVGLDVAPSAVLGRLDDYTTRSGFAISPVVVWVGEPGPMRPNPAEVASVHVVPLSVLEHPEVPRLLPGPDPDRPIIQIPLGERFIHAPTAAVLYQLREVAVHGRWTRVGRFDQPGFAWQ
jgi:8-oxo-dGTP pyrophosphatase MutT (NUDIX family)